MRRRVYYAKGNTSLIGSLHRACTSKAPIFLKSLRSRSAGFNEGRLITAKMASKPIKITCGNLQGFLYPDRFGPAGRSLCIKLDKKEKSEWITPIEFEKKSGKGAQHNWKRTIRSTGHDNKMLWFLLEDKVLKACSDKHCKCQNCTLSREGTFEFLIVFVKLPCVKSNSISELFHFTSFLIILCWWHFNFAIFRGI